MKCLRIARQKAAALLAALAGLLTATAAWAQATAPIGPKNEATTSSGTTGTGAYVLAYMLVLLCIVLGLMLVCRSANRRDRARPEEYVESTLTEAEGKK